MSDGRALWEVIGGKDKGGIVVRQGQDVTSPLLERLSTGALIEEQTLVGDRLHYRLLTGTGPSEGWISLKLASGKELVARADPQASRPPPAANVAASAPEPLEQPPAPLARLPIGRPEPVEGRKIRIVALHAVPANANVMKFQVAPLRQLLGKEVEWIIPDGPVPWTPVAGSATLTEQERTEGEKLIAKGKPFVQWFVGQSGPEDKWSKVSESVEFLHGLLRREAPIDVVLAFSQGAQAVSVLTEHLRRRQQEPPWRLNVFVSGGGASDPAHQLQRPCETPTMYLSGGAQDTFDAAIAAQVAWAYPRWVCVRHGDGHNFPSTPPRAGEVYREVAAEIRRQCGLKPAPAPAPAARAAAPPRQAAAAAATAAVAVAAKSSPGRAELEEDWPAGMWTVDYIGNARGPCKACRTCEYYRWNPNKLRPDMGDDGEATITEWFLNDYDSLRCQSCGCKFSDHKNLGPVNKPAGFYPGLSEEDANALLG